jgi:hypothetical protein
MGQHLVWAADEDEPTVHLSSLPTSRAPLGNR